MQDNEESINSKGPGMWGRGAPATEHGVGLHGLPISSDPHGSPGRKVGQVLSLPFTDEDTEAQRQSVSLVPASFTPSFTHVLILPLSHPLVTPSFRHSLYKHM